MNTYMARKKNHWSYRLLSAFIAMTFIFSMVVPPQASYAQMVPQTVLNLPVPGTMVPLTPGFAPALIKGITIHPDNPLMFNFIVDNGDENLTGEELKKTSKKLIKYFLASLTVPEDDLWVNLSPYEEDRIIPEGFGDTEMGRDLLAMDYMLKQLTSSLMYPENELGKEFWKRVYEKAYEKYGTTEIPVNTFNKIWVIPESAKVYEHENSAFVVESHLKVMLEEDYLALQKNLGNTRFGLDHVEQSDAKVISGASSEIVREILIPEIEKEVNQGKTFANLRQIYNSMILAAWYKLNLKESLLGRVYMNQNKTAGVDTKDKQINQKIYDQYVKAFSKGVYNYIREDYDETTHKIIPRKYFSGGFWLGKNILGIVAAGLMSPSVLPKNVEAAMDTQQDGIFNIGAQVIEETEKKGGKGAKQLDFIIQTTENSVTLKPIGAQLASTNEKKGAEGVAVSSAILTEEEKQKLPQVVLDNIEGGIIVAPQHIQALKLIVQMGSTKLLELWDSPGVNDGFKRAFLEQVESLNEAYPGGLQRYKENVKELLAIAGRGENSLDGVTPEIPEGIDLTRIDKKFKQMEQIGFDNADKLAFMLVAGGTGDRLDFVGGIKLEIPIDLVTEQTYLETYIKNILAIQEKFNKVNGTAIEIPLMIMVSDDTIDKTVELLNKGNSFGMNGYEFVNTFQGQKPSGDKQIILLKQRVVPSVTDMNAEFVLEGTTGVQKYQLQTKPYGHGDMNKLAYESGIMHLWEKQGKTHVVIIQDTNGQVFNGILPALGVSIKEDLDLNFLTVPREAGEAAGAIVKAVMPDGTSKVMNVEYNQLGPLLKATVNPKGDVPDDKGLSPFPGNLNVLIYKISTYADSLDKTEGFYGEFVNPKWTDASKALMMQDGKDVNTSRLSFKKPTRAETMLQDVAVKLPSDAKVQFTNFTKRDVFSPVKNSLVEARAKVESDNYPDAMVTGEFDRYKFFRKLLGMLGVEVKKDGNPKIVQGIPYGKSAKIIFSSRFSVTVKEFFSKFKLSKRKLSRITDRSIMYIDGDDILFEGGLQVDGTVMITTAPGVKLTIKNLDVSNKGKRFVNLTQEEMADPSVPEYLKIRGYHMVTDEKDSLIINITKPGEYELTGNGDLIQIRQTSSPLVEEKIKEYARNEYIKMNKKYPFSINQSFEGLRELSIVYDQSYSLNISFDGVERKILAQINMKGISKPVEVFSIPLDGDVNEMNSFIDKFFTNALSVEMNLEIYIRRQLSKIIEETGRDDIFNILGINQKGVLGVEREVGNERVYVTFDEEKGDALLQRGAWQNGRVIPKVSLSVRLKGDTKEKGIEEAKSFIAKFFDDSLASVESREVASSSPTKTTPLGGINLDPKLLDLQIKRDGNGVPLPVWEQPLDQMNIEGFVPVIINMQMIPFSQVPMLLGLSSEEAPVNSVNNSGDTSSKTWPDAAWILDNRGRVAIIES